MPAAVRAANTLVQNTVRFEHGVPAVHQIARQGHGVDLPVHRALDHGRSQALGAAPVAGGRHPGRQARGLLAQMHVSHEEDVGVSADVGKCIATGRATAGLSIRKRSAH